MGKQVGSEDPGSGRTSYSPGQSGQPCPCLPLPLRPQRAEVPTQEIKGEPGRHHHQRGSPGSPSGGFSFKVIISGVIEHFRIYI